MINRKQVKILDNVRIWWILLSLIGIMMVVLLGGNSNVNAEIIYSDVTKDALVGKDKLKELYHSKNRLQIQGNQYVITISGDQIRNYEKVLNTVIPIKKTEQGIEFELNQDESLPGIISLHIDGTETMKYLYRWNKGTRKFEYIQVADIQEMNMIANGRYLMTEERLHVEKVSIRAWVLLGIISGILALVYMVRKNRHWFW